MKNILFRDEGHVKKVLLFFLALFVFIYVGLSARLVKMDDNLDISKSNAHATLTSAISGYNISDYTSDYWVILNQFKIDGDTAIDTASDLAGVTSAQDTAIAGMAGVDKNLANARNLARDELNSALVSYNTNDYTNVNWILLNQFKTDGDNAITNAIDLTAVSIAKDTAISGMSGVEKITITLSDSKADAHEALNSALTSYSQINYSLNNWNSLNDFKTAGDTAIESATDLASVTSAQESALSQMAGVAKDLADEKISAHLALVNAFSEYIDTNYRANEWEKLKGYKIDGDAAIDASIDLATIISVKNDAITKMSEVKTIAKTLADAKVNAHNNLASIFSNHKSTDYSTDNWNNLNKLRSGADTAIDLAGDLAEVTLAQEAGIISFSSISKKTSNSDNRGSNRKNNVNNNVVKNNSVVVATGSDATSTVATVVVPTEPKIKLDVTPIVLPASASTVSLGKIENKLFDIIFNIENALLKRSKYLIARTQFTSFGNVPTAVNLEYRIENALGREVYNEKGQVTVETEQTVVKEFNNLELDNGKYTVFLTTTYGNNVKDEFKQGFEIRQSFFERYVGILSIIIALIFMSMLALVIIMIHTYQKNNFTKYEKISV